MTHLSKYHIAAMLLDFGHDASSVESVAQGLGSYAAVQQPMRLRFLINQAHDRIREESKNAMALEKLQAQMAPEAPAQPEPARNFSPEMLKPFRISGTVRARESAATGVVVDIHADHGVKVAWNQSGMSVWMLPQHLDLEDPPC